MDCTEIVAVGANGREGRLGLHPRELSLMCAFRMGRARAQRRSPTAWKKSAAFSVGESCQLQLFTSAFFTCLIFFRKWSDDDDLFQRSCKELRFS